ncbi:hypothetical protein TNCV_5073161 [Trichonephila clavipes]|nr:hypothetical protein TNCV_5073161 [Trichonephila clavipes]
MSLHFPNCRGKSCLDGWSRILTPVLSAPSLRVRGLKNGRRYERTARSHAFQAPACLRRRSPIMRRTRSNALRNRQTKDERKAQGAGLF